MKFIAIFGAFLVPYTLGYLTCRYQQQIVAFAKKSLAPDSGGDSND